MARYFTHVVLLLTIFATFGLSAPVIDVETPEGQIKWLQQYQYLGNSSLVPGLASLSSAEAFTAGVKVMQRFANLPETGIVDEQTKAFMKKYRCGMPDMSNMSMFTRRKKRYVLQGSSFAPGSTLTYRINTYHRLLPQNTQDTIFAEAFGHWSRAANINFQQVRGTQPVDIDIMFASGAHGDYEPFDGPGGILAHAFFPSFGGDEHFDDSEAWSYGSYSGTSLLQTATHEIGHTLGLSHSDVPNSVMWPYISSYNPNFGLTNDDIYGIQRIYGAAKGQPAPTMAPTPAATPREIPSTRRPNVPPKETPGNFDPYDICYNGSVDAATQTQDGSTYLFRGDYVYKYNGLGVENGYPVPIGDSQRGFSPMSGRIDAALYWPTTGQTFLFKDYYVGEFRNRDFVGYRYISDILRITLDKVDAAFYWPRNGKTYVTQGDRYWRFETGSGTQESGYPQPMSRWQMPGGVDSAFAYSNGRTYFFKNGNYYRFNDADITMDIGYPKPINYWWFGCRSQVSGSAVQPESNHDSSQIKVIAPVDKNNGVFTEEDNEGSADSALLSTAPSTGIIFSLVILFIIHNFCYL